MAFWKASWGSKTTRRTGRIAIGRGRVRRRRVERSWSVIGGRLVTRRGMIRIVTGRRRLRHCWRSCCAKRRMVPISGLLMRRPNGRWMMMIQMLVMPVTISLTLRPTWILPSWRSLSSNVRLTRLISSAKSWSKGLTTASLKKTCMFRP